MKSLTLVCALVWLLATCAMVQADLLASIGQLIKPTTTTIHHHAAKIHSTHKPKKKSKHHAISTHPLSSPSGTLLTATTIAPTVSVNSSSILPTSLPSNSSVSSTFTTLSLVTPPVSIPPPSTPIVIITSTIPPAPQTNGPALAGGLAESSGSNSIFHTWSTGILFVLVAMYFIQ